MKRAGDGRKSESAVLQWRGFTWGWFGSCSYCAPPDKELSSALVAREASSKSGANKPLVEERPSICFVA